MKTRHCSICGAVLRFLEIDKVWGGSWFYCNHGHAYFIGGVYQA